MIPNFNDPKQKHEHEQSLAFVAETCPRLWYGLYTRCIEEGFTQEQAMTLVVAFIKTPNPS